MFNMNFFQGIIKDTIISSLLREDNYHNTDNCDHENTVILFISAVSEKTISK